MYIPYLLHPFNVMNDTVMNLGLQISLQNSAFNSLENMPKWDLDHMTLLFLIFWGISTLFSTVNGTFYIPTANILYFHQQCIKVQFLCILANTYFLEHSWLIASSYYIFRSTERSMLKACPPWAAPSHGINDAGIQRRYFHQTLNPLFYFWILAWGLWLAWSRFSESCTAVLAFSNQFSFSPLNFSQVPDLNCSLKVPSTYACSLSPLFFMYFPQ